MFITGEPIKKLNGGGGLEGKGGHVLKDATSHGLYDRVWPPHTIERRGGRLPVCELGGHSNDRHALT